MAYRTAPDLPNYILHIGCKVRLEIGRFESHNPDWFKARTGDIGVITRRGYYPSDWGPEMVGPCGWFVKVPWRMTDHYFDDQIVIID